jgi:hypothetical protein
MCPIRHGWVDTLGDDLERRAGFFRGPIELIPLRGIVLRPKSFSVEPVGAGL